jgi:alpha-L-rhamnosidase
VVDYKDIERVVRHLEGLYNSSFDLNKDNHLLGIRPASFGFESVDIAPMPGHLMSLAGERVHPRGSIAADLHFENGRLYGNISLPPELTGTFCFAGKSISLLPGRNSIDV